MEYSLKSGSLIKQGCDCLIVGMFEGQRLTLSAQQIDDACEGLLARISKRCNIQGQLGDTLLINHIPGCKAGQVLLLGLGKQGVLSAARYRKALHAVSLKLKTCGAKKILYALSEVQVEGHEAGWQARQAVESLEATIYQYGETKSKKPKTVDFSKIHWFVGAKQHKKQIQKGLDQGKAIATGVKLAKQLADLPGNICTPSYLAEQAKQVAQSHDKLTCKVLEEEEMEALGMGALLSVSRGSREPAKLIVLEYKGGHVQSKPVVLVGKGLTFDAGGISLKPSAGMDEMKYDMCGGASVLGTLSVAAELNLPLNVVGIVPASENLPDGDANKPGDVVTSMAGQTIEILNTDAEGRLILCDALTYAARYNPEVVIDIATLTGAIIVALGRHPSGLMGNDDSLCEALTEAGLYAGDRLWRLPLWDDYQDQLKSKFADIANIGGRDAGSITAGCFLSRFTQEYSWAHIDIAGTAWKTGAAKGATGRPVALLSQYLLNRVSD